MAHAKIAVTINDRLLVELDGLVRERVFKNRSQAIQEAIGEKLERLSRGRLARECAKLDPACEKALAEEGMSIEAEKWPEY